MALRTMSELIADLASKGGAIVSSNDCSHIEIADARANGRMFVREDGLGFVLRHPEWLADVIRRREEHGDILRVIKDAKRIFTEPEYSAHDESLQLDMMDVLIDKCEAPEAT